ncbi:MAG: trigger factor [Thermoanaerobaculia bacterium]
MLIELKDITPIRKSVEVEIPADAIQKEFQSVTMEFARQAKIPGFRPGKTPTGVVRKRFLKEIEEEVRDRLLPRFFHEAVSEHSLEPVGNPSLLSIDDLVEGKPVRFAAEFEIKPTVQLGEYKGIEIGEPAVEVTDKDIDDMIERFRDRAASFRTVSDRPAVDGDYLVVNVTSSAEGVERRTNDGYTMQLGENAPLPELNDALRGKSTGERVEFDKTYVDDAPNEEVRNKTVHYEVELREVRLLEKPDVDDAFAKSISVGETVEEMRAKIGEDLKRHREHEATEAKRRQIAEKLVDLHELEVPSTLVADEVERSIRNYARFLASQGVDIEKAQLDWAKLRDEFVPDATRRVKRGLILEAIGRAESIEIGDAEVDTEIRKASQGAQREFAEIKHRLRHDGGYEELRTGLLQEKALDLVLKEARLRPASA